MATSVEVRPRRMRRSRGLITTGFSLGEWPVYLLLILGL